MAPTVPGQGLVDVGGGVIAYVSTPWSFSTTSYAIEGPDGLVLVDTQFLPKEALAFVDAVERKTGKRAVAAIVLHANPDKFNGTAALQARGIKVVTSAQVAQLIPSVHAKRLRAFGERYAPDYPTVEPKPDVFGDADTTLRFAGLALNAHVVGGGCSAAHVVLEHDGDVFAGDLVANGTHSWLELGLTPQWHERIREMRALHPKRVLPGRGLPGGPALLDDEDAYLSAVSAAVAAERPQQVEPSEDALTRIKKALIAEHPSLRFPVFLDIGLPAEWRRQALLGGSP
jgi:glyoxylase-like metal-dependent hydrolase (beta-lactamase superfamily II)